MRVGEGAVAPASVPEMVERLRRLPDGSRTYGCDEHFAALHFGLDRAALRELVATGLPSAWIGDQLRFEFGDLHYVGLRLRRATTFLWAARQWASGLERFARNARSAVTIEYVPQLAVAAGPTHGCVRLLDGSRRAVVFENGRSAAVGEISLSADWPALPAPAARVVREFGAAVDFYLLPAVLQDDGERARQIGLSDCRTAARAIVEGWRAAALEARVSQGLFVSVPYSTLHTWPEVRVGDRWVPADPLMLGVMRDFGGLDGARWPLDRSPGAMLWRVGEHADALAVTASGPIPTTFLTRMADGLS